MAVGVYGVSYGTDQVGYVVSQSVLWWEDVVWYGLWLVWDVWIVVLESFFLWVEDCGSCIVVSFVVSGMSDVKSFMGVLPRSRPIIGHLPPFVFCSS